MNNSIIYLLSIASIIGSLCANADRGVLTLREQATLALADSMNIEEIKETLAKLSIEQAEAFLTTLLLYGDLTPAGQCELIGAVREREDLSRRQVESYEILERQLLFGHSMDLSLAF